MNLKISVQRKLTIILFIEFTAIFGIMYSVSTENESHFSLSFVTVSPTLLILFHFVKKYGFS